MSIQIPGFSSPVAGFEAPLTMLSNCHRRIERQCATLLRLVPHVAAHGADEQARTAAANVLRYFGTAAAYHHADEDEDLFPALLESMAGSDATCLRAWTDIQTSEHRLLDARWHQLRPPLARLAAGEAVAPALADVTAFSELYRRHIEREDAEILPMAARLLSDAALERLGTAMRRRRAAP